MDPPEPLQLVVPEGLHTEAEAIDTGGAETFQLCGVDGLGIGFEGDFRVGGEIEAISDRDDVLFAIRNGGFSGAIMPANVVVGKDAQDVALFVERYAGKKAPAQSGQSTSKGGG